MHSGNIRQARHLRHTTWQCRVQVQCRRGTSAGPGTAARTPTPTQATPHASPPLSQRARWYRPQAPAAAGSGTKIAAELPTASLHRSRTVAAVQLAIPRKLRTSKAAPDIQLLANAEKPEPAHAGPRPKSCCFPLYPGHNAP